MDPPAPGECCSGPSGPICGNVVMKSAMVVWLFMNPASEGPHAVSIPGWVACGDRMAPAPGPAATEASQKPPPPSFARTGVSDLVFTDTNPSLSSWPGSRAFCNTWSWLCSSWWNSGWLLIKFFHFTPTGQLPFQLLNSFSKTTFCKFNQSSKNR